MKYGTRAIVTATAASLLLTGCTQLDTLRDEAGNLDLNDRATPSTPPQADPGKGEARPGAIDPVTQLTYGPGPTNYKVEDQPGPGACAYRVIDSTTGHVLPDPRCTPGMLNPKVTPQTMHRTICRGGYSKSIRPSTKITNREKAANARSYTYTGDWDTSEYDHLVPLSLGGEPNDPRNLWVQPNAHGAKGTHNPKDRYVSSLHSLVCGGWVDLRSAQKVMATNWTNAKNLIADGKKKKRAAKASH